MHPKKSPTLVMQGKINRLFLFRVMPLKGHRRGKKRGGYVFNFLLHRSRKKQSLIIGSFSNDDGDGNENVS